MDHESMKLTKFDSMLTSRTMQLVKAVIPYIDGDTSAMLGMIIKFQELRNAAALRSTNAVSAMNADNSQSKMENLFHDIREFLSEEEQETMDMMMSMMEMMNMDEDARQNFMDGYMDMFGMGDDSAHDYQNF